MSKTVELGDLAKVLETSAPSPGSSFQASFFYGAVYIDTLLALHGSGLIAPLLAGKASVNPANVAVLLIGLQFLLLFITWRALSHSGLQGSILPEAKAITTFGAAEPDAVKSKAPILIATGVLALIILAIAWSAPLPESGLAKLLLIAAAPLDGWALIALAARGWRAATELEDRSILAGLVAGIGTVLVGMFAIGPTAASLGWLMMPGWFALTEASLLVLLPLALAGTMIQFRRTVYRLTVDNPLNGPSLVEYSPFATASRLPRYISFGATQGQIIVMTRALNADNWRLIDVTDAQRLLPLHDRTLLIWNLTKLSQAIPPQIEAADAESNFAMTMAIGQLALPAGLDMTTRLDRWAVSAANDALFRNSDLSGLMGRAARAAFGHKVGALSGEIEEIQDFLERAPTTTSLAGLSRTDGGGAALEAASRMFSAAIASGNAYLTELQEKQARFRAIKKAALNSGADIEREWLERMVGEIVRAAEGMKDERGVDIGEAVRVLRVIGLRSNGASVRLIGGAAECEARLPSTRGEVNGLVASAEASRREALMQEDNRRAAIEAQVIGPNIFSRNEQRHYAAGRLAGRALGEKIEGPDAGGVMGSLPSQAGDGAADADGADDRRDADDGLN